MSTAHIIVQATIIIQREVPALMKPINRPWGSHLRSQQPWTLKSWLFRSKWWRSMLRRIRSVRRKRPSNVLRVKEGKKSGSRKKFRASGLNQQDSLQLRQVRIRRNRQLRGRRKKTSLINTVRIKEERPILTLISEEVRSSLSPFLNPTSLIPRTLVLL